ncbi:MAG: hypothetical protein BAJALOKI1v1_1100018 [Promethearchaeota archaeon]|nr:MAG: hypothetical protein BAJALOKI1v1_1100018 [Candidatus Lokiarchaeota archaeon]
MDKIHIFSVIELNNNFKFDKVNKILSKNLGNNIELNSLDFKVEENNNLYAYHLMVEEKAILSVSIIENKINWITPISQILNENIIQMKKTFEVLQNG